MDQSIVLGTSAIHRYSIHECRLLHALAPPFSGLPALIPPLLSVNDRPPLCGNGKATSSSHAPPTEAPISQGDRLADYW